MIIGAKNEGEREREREGEGGREREREREREEGERSGPVSSSAVWSTRPVN